MYAVIGNTNRSNEPSLFCFDECAPGAIAGLLTTVGGMDEVSVRKKMLRCYILCKDSPRLRISCVIGPSFSQSAGYSNSLECDQDSFKLASGV